MFTYAKKTIFYVASAAQNRNQSVMVKKLWGDEEHHIPFTSFSVNFNKTHKCRLIHGIKYDVYKSTQDNKYLKNLKFGLLRCFKVFGCFSKPLKLSVFGAIFQAWLLDHDVCGWPSHAPRRRLL